MGDSSLRRPEEFPGFLSLPVVSFFDRATGHQNLNTPLKSFLLPPLPLPLPSC